MTYLILGLVQVMALALIVVFQEELRSACARVATRALSRKAVAPPLDLSDNAVLARSLADLAGDHIGALVVLRGQDALDRHIVGGWELNGNLSEPLLKSIFDPHSLGHDGAVVIEGGKVTRFGVHLPLSKNFNKIASFGTRHSAALGLSERTDALCLVVSENTGMVAVARGGRLSVLDNARDLRAILSALKAPASSVASRPLNSRVLAEPVSISS